MEKKTVFGESFQEKIVLGKIVLRKVEQPKKEEEDRSWKSRRK